MWLDTVDASDLYLNGKNLSKCRVDDDDEDGWAKLYEFEGDYLIEELS
jgi:hypothetical protein